MRHRNLASERVRIGLSQTELSEKLDYSLASISDYENFKRDMPITFVVKASDFFGCSIDYLLDRTDERLPHVNEP